MSNAPRAYYNEIDPYAAQWLRNLIQAGHIAPGDVDTRSIVDVRPEELSGYTQCHFFAGIGGWSLAARLAGWPDDRELWTGSCPCQPFSVAGKQAGQEDARHLWPELFRLVSARAPAVLMGEQVAAAVGKDWLDGVCSDLEGIGYATGAAVIPAAAVDAPHRRDRLWFVADTGCGRLGGPSEGQSQQSRGAEAFGASDCDVADAARLGSRAGFCEGRSIQNGNGASGGGRSHVVADADEPCASAERAERSRQFCRAGRNSSDWSGAAWVIGADGKARRVEPSIRLLAHGVPARVGKLRAYGNAIVPQVAAEVIGAFMEASS